MGFIDNFKYNYQKKIFQSALNDKNVIELEKLVLLYLQSKNPLYFNLLAENIDSIQNILEDSNNSMPNIVWLNSFDEKLNDFLEKFLDFYFLNSAKNLNYSFNSYVNEVIEKLSVFEMPLNLTVSDFVFNSSFYQLLISYEKKNQIIFLKNDMAFFEHESGKKFTYTNFTNSYFYLLQNPKNIYLKLKNDREGANDLGKSLFNLDQQPLNKTIRHQGLEHHVEIYRSSWENNVSSWDSENVKNTYRGLLLKLEDIIDDPVFYLASIIGHLSQSNIDVEIDYKLIQQFVLNNGLPNIEVSGDLSNKELKIFKREISKKAKEHGYL